MMDLLNKIASLAILMMLAFMPSYLSGSGDSGNSPKEQRQGELYREMAQNQQKITHHLRLMIRLVERMKRGRASSAREKARDMNQALISSAFLNRYHPGFLDLMSRLKSQIDKNQADKEEFKKMLDGLVAQMQKGIEAIMQMLDTAVSSTSGPLEGPP